MSEPIILLDTSEIREGRLEDVKTAFRELADFVEENEPQAIAYHVYLSEDATRVTVVQIHPDSASVEFHMKAAADLFPRFAKLLRLSRLEIFGRPSPDLLDQMRAKARMLGDAPVDVYDLHAGFARLRRQE
jgi:quinol monooxygenase YgiN